MRKINRVAVTGGKGLIGRVLVRELLDRGYQVLNLDRQRGNDERAQFVYCDVRQRESLGQILQGCDAVCHLAEIPNISSHLGLDEVYWSNARAAGVVLQTAADLRMKRVIYASSCQVYGCWDHYRVAPIRLPIDETYPVRPRNPYSVSKVGNELFAQFVSEQEGLPISIFRLPWVVSQDFSDGQVDHFERNDGPVDDGLATFIHVSDVARGFAAALEADREGCEIYNLAAPDVLSGMPLRERLLKNHPGFPQLPEDWPAHKSPVLTERARTRLGWEAKWSFGEYFRARRSRQPGRNG